MYSTAPMSQSRCPSPSPSGAGQPRRLQMHLDFRRKSADIRLADFDAPSCRAALVGPIRKRRLQIRGGGVPISRIPGESDKSGRKQQKNSAEWPFGHTDDIAVLALKIDALASWPQNGHSAGATCNPDQRLKTMYRRTSLLPE